MVMLQMKNEKKKKI
ncbi:hypothetical protein PMLGA01_050028600 [Plasmodium malariae]|uniref:Uncharacterized protein n=1 Tax=Plasmodium malariae TaxID=5858 RepID=A0A1C3KM44_PLAMA|nr:hypothetical protein PMLGA01_050028600 [Plasmodium malariae]